MGVQLTFLCLNFEFETINKRVVKSKQSISVSFDILRTSSLLSTDALENGNTRNNFVTLENSEIFNQKIFEIDSMCALQQKNQIFLFHLVVLIKNFETF